MRNCQPQLGAMQSVAVVLGIVLASLHDSALGVSTHSRAGLVCVFDTFGPLATDSALLLLPFWLLARHVHFFGKRFQIAVLRGSASGDLIRVVRSFTRSCTRRGALPET